MKKLPKFKLALSENLEIHSSDIKNSILFFYPKAMTSGCTIEVCDFQANFNKFKKLGFTIIGISKDDLEKNLKFAKKYKIKYPLASDKDKVCEKLGIWVEKSMYGKTYMGIERSTFLFDENLQLIQSWRKVKVNGHAEEVLNSID